MTAVDEAALERVSSAAVELLGLTTLHASGVSPGISGFDAFGRVYVSVSVAEFRRASRADTLTVTVQQSADGASWESAADPLVFSGDGVLFAEVAAPLSHLRVSWVFSARLKSCRITSASAIPGSLDAPPGGGSQPEKIISLAVAFNTPNLVITDGGVPLYTAVAGDLIPYYPYAVIPVSVSFNGTTPRLVVFAEGDDPTDGGNLLSVSQQLLAGSTQGTHAVTVDNYIGPSAGNNGLQIQDGVRLMLALDDGSGGDPGATAGAGVVNYVIQPGVLP